MKSGFRCGGAVFFRWVGSACIALALTAAPLSVSGAPSGRDAPAVHDAPAARDAPTVRDARHEGAGSGVKAIAHAAPEHAEHAAHDESALPPPINWWHGLLGEKPGVEPNLLYREAGEPPPFLASLINFGVLVFIVVRFGRKPLAAALSKRKQTLTREIDEAQRLRREAEERLQQYESRLEKIGDELERVRREFREQGERDKERIVREANERRVQMHKDAELLLAQEVKEMRHDLLVEVVNEATRVAVDLLATRLTLGDHDRFAEAFLTQVRAKYRRGGGASVPVSAVAKGGTS
jgi:F-type H+-transporting ATPase subunit b